jgi:class 3 adenylate cyclase
MSEWYNNSTEASGIRFAFPAVMFADIAGSTSLYDALGDSAAKTLVDECLIVMRDATKRHHGRVIKTIGDELMCVFFDSDSCSLAAADMQLAVSELPQTGGVRRMIRVGFHSGPLIAADGDVFGDTVNTAARMAGLAKGGQIITTSATVARMAPLLRASTRHIAALSIRGKGDDVDVCEVLWRANEDLTMATSSAASLIAHSLDLRHGSRQLTLEGAGTRLVIGRDPTNHIVLLGRKASRVHARIEFRRDKFFLTDQSTNGTYVNFTGEPEVALRHEEVMLRGHGQITFGHSLADSQQETLEFLVR